MNQQQQKTRENEIHACVEMLSTLTEDEKVRAIQCINTNQPWKRAHSPDPYADKTNADNNQFGGSKNCTVSVGRRRTRRRRRRRRRRKTRTKRRRRRSRKR